MNEPIPTVSSKVDRIDRASGGPIDVDNLQRRSWSGFSAEFVRIPALLEYDFKVRGTSAHLFLLDLQRTDGETFVSEEALRLSSKDLRNRMIFAPPGCTVDGWSALERAGSVMTVAISPDVQDEMGIDLDGLPPLLGFEDEMLRGAVHRFQELLADPAAESPGYAETIVELMSFDLARISRSVSHAAVGALAPQQVQIVTDYIDANLSQRPRVSDLADLVNLTRFHFMRSFKQAVGIPPHQFVITRRIERAKELLAEGNHTIASVATETGFGTSIQLARAFRRAIGTTPSEYRRAVM